MFQICIFHYITTIDHLTARTTEIHLILALLGIIQLVILDAADMTVERNNFNRHRPLFLATLSRHTF